VTNGRCVRGGTRASRCRRVERGSMEETTVRILGPSPVEVRPSNQLELALRPKLSILPPKRPERSRPRWSRRVRRSAPPPVSYHRIRFIARRSREPRTTRRRSDRAPYRSISAPTTQRKARTRRRETFL
jgi:hypothetical protein